MDVEILKIIFKQILWGKPLSALLAADESIMHFVNCFVNCSSTTSAIGEAVYIQRTVYIYTEKAKTQSM